VYQPSSGVVQVGTDRGGQLDFDQSGLEGLTRRRVETDLDSWHWENLSFPAGVRMGQFRSTRRTGVSAAGRFGPGGFEGRLNTGTFRNPADAVIQTRSGTIFAAHLNPDGTFNVGQNDALPAGQYLSTAVLNDRQQRRQDLYRRLLDTGKKYSYLDHDRLFVWCEFDDLPFAVDGAERKVGTALLSVPIEYEPSGSGELTLPGGFVPYTAFSAGRSYPPRLNHTEPIRTRLRFQLPDCGRPFSVERATFQARVRAPGRRFTVSGIAEGQSVQTFEQLNPAGSVRIEIAEPRFLRTDAEGGLFLEFAMSEMIGADGREKSLKSQETGLKWEIEAINLEVRGRLVGN
ncbi:MAG TPA: hypothetical protein VLM40_12340, partial [Gemmata sp.]|nr:hypothetical protein [Gemmata sp.]